MYLFMPIFMKFTKNMYNFNAKCLIKKYLQINKKKFKKKMIISTKYKKMTKIMNCSAGLKWVLGGFDHKILV